MKMDALEKIFEEIAELREKSQLKFDDGEFNVKSDEIIRQDAYTEISLIILKYLI